MQCVLVQENWVNYSDAVYDRVGNIEMSRIMGADVRLDAAGFDIGIRPSWEQAMADVVERGGKPFPIPAGCSEHPYGGLGFVGFAEEVRQQEEELGFTFDYIVVCSVTGSTQAGMVVGFAEDGRSRRVIGIDASAKPEQTRAQILRIAQQTGELVELESPITADDVVLDTRYGYPEYGLPNDGTLEAIRLCARLEGVLTDPVYEGKSMQGMIDMVRKGEFPEGSRVLYAHLGGVPALNAYSILFRDG
jgi:1-aminocyclopropane-1-carboxylate deaminase